jgi:hypothetical protein
MRKLINAESRRLLGMAIISFCLLLYQILLTRIFSVIAWYHFVFFAISATMFGLTLGSLLVFIFPGFYKKENESDHLFSHSFFLGMSITLSLAYLSLFERFFGDPFAGIGLIGLTFLVTSVPFTLGGVCVSLLLTHANENTGKMYAADLFGASFGCIGVLLILKFVDAPSAVVICGSSLSLTALMLFAPSDRLKRWKPLAAVGTLILLAAISFNSSFFNIVTFKTGMDKEIPLFEKWNSFSRIRVSGDPVAKQSPPFGWGLSSKLPPNLESRELQLIIDGVSGTVLTGFDGNLGKLDYLKYDVTNIGHYLRNQADVFIVGTGGGRDILSALAFHQKSVMGAEINPAIVEAVNEKFGDFTGHLDRNPKVTFINDEARSFLASTDKKFDMIMISLVDTYAATSTGAYALTENALYTTEGFVTFLSRLKDRGVLSVSRWYVDENPFEIYRLLSITSSALNAIGVSDPGKHMIIVKKQKFAGDTGKYASVGTLLVSNQKFSDQDLHQLKEVSARLGFEIILDSEYSKNSAFAALSSPQVSDKPVNPVLSSFPASTDDRPFFFQFDQFGQFVRNGFNRGPLGLLFSFLVVSFFFALLLILLPIFQKKNPGAGKNPPRSLPFYFVFIGLGFLLIELSQMQRMGIFLGHPVYALSVTLFSLLLFSSLGSLSVDKLNISANAKKEGYTFTLLLITLVLFGFLTPLITHLHYSFLGTRIISAVFLLGPLGYFMGTMLPLGMKKASLYNENFKPWFWGLNGASSVIASVIATVISITLGISYAYWLGCLCYGAAVMAFFTVKHPSS